MDPVLFLIFAIFFGGIVYLLYRMRWARGPQTRLMDLVLYVVVALLLISGFGAILFLAMSRHAPDVAIVKWMNIILTAIFAFGIATKEYWRFRSRWTFWAELTVLLTAHFVVLSRLRLSEGAYFWLVIVVGIPEMVLIFVLLDLMYNSGRERSSSRETASIESPQDGRDS